MNYLDLMDDYLADKLPDEEKAAFEKQVETDYALQQELAFQKQVVLGIQQARARELKAIMNNVQISGWQSGNTGLMAKIAAGVLVSGALIFTAYFFFKKEAEETPREELVEASIDEPESIDIADTSAIEEESDSIKLESNEVKEQAEVKSPTVKKEKSVKAQPNITVLDFETENEQAPAIDTNVSDEQAGAFSPYDLPIDIDDTHNRYNFHYQFKDERLILYGKFDKSLYEVIEFNTNDQRTIYFYYKNNFYRLDPRQSKITSLEPIKDTSLLNKLQRYRE